MGKIPATVSAGQPARIATTQRIGWGLLLLFGAVAFFYSLVVPPFETPDEPFHYAFARHVAAGNGLPVQSADGHGPWEQEGSQAPLYYLITGALTSWIDQQDYVTTGVRNPRANIGDPLEPGNKNFMLYSGFDWPLTGSVLALHIGRWFSVLCGALTVFFTWRTARLAFPGREELALLAAATVAAIPQFHFISASFSNDNMITVVSAATIFQLARLLALPGQAPIARREWLVLGTLLGLAALSKLQGLGLFVAATPVVLWLAWRRRNARLVVEAALLAGAPALLIAGWWYVRNIQLYGDWSGLGFLLQFNGARGSALEWEDIWPEFRGLRYSFWGLFGWFNILYAGWVYTLLDGLTVAALAGLLWRLLAGRKAATHAGTATAPATAAERSGRPVMLLLTWWALLCFGLLVYWTIRATGSQGRLLFPAIGSLAVLLVAGVEPWLGWLPERWRIARWKPPLFLTGLSLFALAGLLPAAYRPAQPVPALPAAAAPAAITYGDVEPIQLRGFEVGEERYAWGQRVPVTLYWQADATPAANYQLFLQLLDENGREIANITSHPGWGRNPTSRWPAGALLPDRYELLIKQNPGEGAPLRARLYAGFIDPATEEITNLPLPARDSAGGEIVPILTGVTVAPAGVPALAGPAVQPAGAVFGAVMRLAQTAVTLQQTGTATATLEIGLLWEAVGQPATDYTVFVHLIGPAGERLAGDDRPPAGERFPTRFWRSGDLIRSDISLPLPAELPAGGVTLWAGVYESGASELRLPVTDAGGLVAGDGQVQIELGSVLP
jgi:hypothetical protein